GRHDEGDLRDVRTRMTGGEEEVGPLVAHLRDTLSDGGFLENEAFEEMRQARHRSFADEPVRASVHTGSAYPADPSELRALLAGYLARAPRPPRPEGELVGIAAPHVSPEGAWRSYGAAYSTLTPDLGDRTFVILGTSHYGQPERFGVTREPFRTPLGDTTVDDGLVSRIVAAGGEAVCVEDYCHAVEHSIEFQVVFLQHLYGPGVRIVPLLCGAFAAATREDGEPEDDPAVRGVVAGLAGVARAGA